MDRQLHDVAWYMRTFDAPPAGRLLLHFGAVDYRATVWVNGTQVAQHEGGHTPFSADLSGVVREHANELVVRAEDPATDLTIPRGKQYWKERGESIFYTPTTGIWQTVWLEPVPAAHIEGLRLLPDLAAGARSGRSSTRWWCGSQNPATWSPATSGCARWRPATAASCSTASPTCSAWCSTRAT